MNNEKQQIETSQCTLCAGTKSPGFYHGCMIKDGVLTETDWNCDGCGVLTRTANIEKEHE